MPIVLPLVGDLYKDDDEKTNEKSEVVAGPYHEAFGQLVEDSIWYDSILEKIKKFNELILDLEIKLTKTKNKYYGLLEYFIFETRNISYLEQILKTFPNENSISISNENGNEFKMIKHKGKVYYCLIINQYLPKVQLYDTFGKFCQMVNIKNVKPIYNQTDKKYV